MFKEPPYDHYAFHKKGLDIESYKQADVPENPFNIPISGRCADQSNVSFKMIKSIKTGMNRFFVEQSVARNIAYGFILLAWLILFLSTEPSLTLRKVVITAVFFPLVGIITYYFMGFGTALLRLFTNKLWVYQLIYWYGLVVSIGCLFAMATPNSELQEADLLVFVGLAVSLSARSVYFNCQKLNKKKN